MADETLEGFVLTSEDKNKLEEILKDSVEATSTEELAEKPFQLSNKKKDLVFNELRARGLSVKEANKALSTIVKVVES